MFGIKKKTKQKLRERLTVIIAREDKLASKMVELDDYAKSLDKREDEIIRDANSNNIESRNLGEWEERLNRYKREVIDGTIERRDSEISDLNNTIKDLNSKIEDLTKENGVMITEKLEYLTALRRLGAEIKLR